MGKDHDVVKCSTNSALNDFIHVQGMQITDKRSFYAHKRLVVSFCTLCSNKKLLEKLTSKPSFVIPATLGICLHFSNTPRCMDGSAKAREKLCAACTAAAAKQSPSPQRLLHRCLSIDKGKSSLHGSSQKLSSVA